MKQMLIDEKKYKEIMQTTVEPYNQARMKKLWFEREKDCRIHCGYYQSDSPQGIVLISHGFTETIEKYQENIYYFLKNNYSVFMPEHCGHGFSYRFVQDPSLVHVEGTGRYVKDLLYIARKIKKEHPDLPLYLFSHSMGGGIAAVAAGKAPGLFEKVILSSPMIQPFTGGIPWKAAVSAAAVMCAAGKGNTYILGGKPYEDIRDFANSCSTSEARYDYYQDKRKDQVQLQTCCASYGWLRWADILYQYLMKEAWKHIEGPLLFIQAELDTVVSNEEQQRFIEYLKGNTLCRLEFVQIEGAKHEIFNGSNDVLETYWETVFGFLNK